MLDFTPLSIYKLVFMAEILIAEGLFTFRLKKRKYFAFRCIGSIAVCFLCAFLYPVFFFNAGYTSIMFFVLFAVTLLLLKFCYDETWLKTIFCGVGAYSVQHLSYSLFCFVIYLIEGPASSVHDIYMDQMDEGALNLVSVIVYLAAYYLVYWLTYLFFGRKVKKGNDMVIGRTLLLIAGLIIFADVVLNSIAVYNFNDENNYIFIIIIYLYGMISCIMAMSMQFSIVDKMRLQNELGTIEQLWLQQQKQYERSKENIDLINIKCHDLKHQISALKGKIDDEEREEIEKAILIYDSVVKTGNDALDVILTEKSFLCENNGISLTCIVDGEKIRFISNHDLYSLFGNAIDNAFESVRNIADIEKRVISFSVKEINNFIAVHIENYFEGELVFKSGLPVTKKDDKYNHGFGLKSMILIAEKYNGNLTVHTDKDKFFLDIYFPVKAADKGAF